MEDLQISHLISAAQRPRYDVIDVMGTFHEAGEHQAAGRADPILLLRDVENELRRAEFDKFSKTLTWEGYAERIRAPYLCIGGEADELSPIANAERCVKAIPGPKRLVIYQDSRHSVGGVPSAFLRPSSTGLQAMDGGGARW